MAQFFAYKPTNIIQVQNFSGWVLESTAQRIIVTDGTLYAVYEGYFQYGTGSPEGAIQRFTYGDVKDMYFQVDGLNYDASLFDYLATSGRTAQLAGDILSDDDYIGGSEGNDVLSGFEGNDRVETGGGNDIILETQGNDLTDGGDGLDMIVLTGRTQDYTFSRQGPGVIIGDPALGERDEVYAVERFRFADGTLALDTGTGENAGVVFRTYQAAYDRTPDQAGLGFWINAADQGTSFEQIAAGFLQSSEFAAAYGTNPSAETFVAKLYENVLGRPGEQGGIDFWKSALADGMDEATVLYRFAESSENVALLAPQIQDGIFFV